MQNGDQPDSRVNLTDQRLGTDDEATEPGTLRADPDQAAPVAESSEVPPATARLIIPGYEVLRELGRGGMGVVYEAIDLARNAPVALKTARQKDPAAIYRFKQEFRALADLSHPNLIPLYELSVTGDEWFLTMPLINGVDFLSYVRPEPGPRIVEWVPNSPGAAATGQAQTTQRTAGSESGATFERAGELEPKTQPEPAPAFVGRAETATTELGGDLETHGRETREPKTDPFYEGTTFDMSRSVEMKLMKPGRAGFRRRRSDNPLDLGRLRGALPQLARGVLALHGAGKLHRDIKPSNVLVRDDGTVLLLDFGLVAERVTTPGGLEGVGSGPLYETDDSLAGTAAYMAPEQAAGQPLSPASDWYAVGVMLFESLTGWLPFQGRVREVLCAKRQAEAVPPISLDPSVPPDLNQLCIELLRRNPAERLSGPEILARLSEDISGETTTEGEIAVPAIPLVGRREELDFLDASFAEVLAGKATTVEVHGRSGAGKTSLVQHFLDKLAARRDVVVLTGRCFEQESIPYKGVDQLVDALTRYLGRLRLPEAQALLPREIGAMARIFPVLGRVEAVAATAPTAVIFPDLQELRNRAFGALRELLARLAADHPLVLCIDDIQWGDTDSAALLTEILRLPDPPRLLLLVCYRSEYVETSACLKALKAALDADGPVTLHRELRIAPLPPEAARELALLLLQGQGRDLVERAEHIARESGGNPYFVYELARHVMEGVDLPSHQQGINLDDVLWTRIQRLPAESRHFLETLAVAGQPVKVGLAYTASDLMTAQQQVVGQLRSGRLVRGTGPHLDDDIETYHDRIREVVVDRLVPASRAHHHGRLAVTLEAASAADPETLAVHFQGAGRVIEAGRYYAEAAALSAPALAFDRAAKLYRKSIELRPLAGDEGRRLRVHLAEALANAGCCAEAADEYLAAAETAETAERIELERRAAIQYCAGGQMDAGRRALRTVLGRVGMRLPDTKLQAISMLLWNRLRLSLRGLAFREREVAAIPADELTRIDLAWSVGTGLASKNILIGPAFQSLNLLLALRAGEPHRIARALCWEATQVSIDGMKAYPRTTALLQTAETLGRRLDQPYVHGMIAMAQGYRDFCLGRWRSGRLRLEEAIGIFSERCTGAAGELGQANTYHLWCTSYEGDWPEVCRRSARLLKEAQEKGDLFTQVNLGTFMEPLSRLAEDRPDEAREVIADSIRRWSREEFNVQNMTALMGSTYVDLYRGDPRATYDRHCQQWPALQGSFLLHSQICRLLVPELRARSALGVADSSPNPAPLLREVDRRARRIERENMPYGNALAMLLRAGLAVIRRDPAQAERYLSEAARAFDSVPMHLFAAVARRRLGELRGGSEGQELIAASTQWMRNHEIQNPERMTAAITPWTPRFRSRQ